MNTQVTGLSGEDQTDHIPEESFQLDTFGGFSNFSLHPGISQDHHFPGVL